MKDKILVNIRTDHTLECAIDTIGREGEGNTSRFEITIPEKLSGCSVYLDFEKPDGDKLRTPKLEIKTGVAVYDVEPYLLTEGGEVKVQAVFQAENGQIWKSSTKKYINHNSINAIDDIPQKKDFVFETQKALDALDEITSANSKRITNLENGYADKLFITQRNGYGFDVPSNALPYASINECDYRMRARPIISYKREKEPKQMAMLSNVSSSTSTLKAVKLDDGSIKITGYTQEAGSNLMELADITFEIDETTGIVSENVSYTITSRKGNSVSQCMIEFAIRDNYYNMTNLRENENVLFQSQASTNSLMVSIGAPMGCDMNEVEIIVKFETQGDSVTEVEIDRFEIPSISGAVGGTHYIDFDRRVLVNRYTGEEKDISKSLSADNFIKVAPDGYIFITDSTAGGIENEYVDITFMLKGV